MIVYKGILQRLFAAGWSSYRLAKEHLISPSTLDRIRSGQPINTTTIDTICRLCGCQPGDLLQYKPDEREG